VMKSFAILFNEKLNVMSWTVTHSRATDG